MIQSFENDTELSGADISEGAFLLSSCECMTELRLTYISIDGVQILTPKHPEYQ